MNQQAPQIKNLKLALFFILSVFGIILLSFLWKISILIRQSRYDGKHQFVLEISNSVNQIVCFSPEDNTVSILSISGLQDNKDFGKEISIPVDGHLYIQNTTESISSDISKSIFHYSKGEDINFIDKLKLWWFIKSVHSDTITSDSVRIPITESIYLRTVKKMCIDKSIFQEAQTIEIINATGVSGYGLRLEKLLTNIGGNVIMVTTDQTEESKSSISFTQPSYTLERIKHLLQITKTFSSSKTEIADIIIKIGKDKINTITF